MPLYEYQCRKCGHAFERLARNVSDKPGSCPKCGARNPVKQLSVFSAPDDAGSAEHGSSCTTGTCPMGTCRLS